MPIQNVRLNLNNPRTIEDKQFHDLVKSVRNDGFMLSIRFLVVDKDNVVLGGNQRFRACQVAGLKYVYVVKAADLNQDQIKEFIINDNTYYGDWDKELVTQFYSDRELVEVGMDLTEIKQPDLQTFGDSQAEIDQPDIDKRKETYDNNKIKQIVVYFPADLYEKVVQSMDAIKFHMGIQETPEVLLQLITYWKQNYDGHV